MRLVSLLLLCACLPHAGGECSSDAECTGGPAGSFCAENVCQGPPEGALEALPARVFGRGETLHVRLHVHRAHGFATARVVLAGSAVGAVPETDGALGAQVPLSLAPAGVEGAVPLSVELHDNLGHTTTFPASVMVDDLPPRLAFDARTVPVSAVLRGTKLTLRITAQDLTAITIDGTTGSADGSFSLPVDTSTAPPGASVMTVPASATDLAGNHSTITAQIPLTRVKFIAQPPPTHSIQSLVLTDTQILALAGQNEFWFLNRADGVQLSRSSTTGVVFPRIATDGSRLFFGRDTDDMLCRLLPDGTLQACCGPFAKLTNGPILSGTTAITATGASTTIFSQSLIAQPDFGTNCGTPIIAEKIADFTQTVPAIAPDGTVYAGASKAVVAAQFDGFVWNPATVTAESAFYVDQPAFRDAGTILLSLFHVGGFDTFTFQKPPTTAFGPVSKSLGTSSILAPTIAADGTALIAGDNFLFALNADGSIRWSRVFNDQLTAPATAGAGDIVYAGMLSGQILALSLTDGATIWSYDGKIPVRGSLAPGCDGILYAGTDAGVVALVIDFRGLASSPWPKAGHDVRGTSDSRRPLRSPTGACLE